MRSRALLHSDGPSRQAGLRPQVTLVVTRLPWLPAPAPYRPRPHGTTWRRLRISARSYAVSPDQGRVQHDRQNDGTHDVTTDAPAAPNCPATKLSSTGKSNRLRASPANTASEFLARRRPPDLPTHRGWQTSPPALKAVDWMRWGAGTIPKSAPGSATELTHLAADSPTRPVAADASTHTWDGVRLNVESTWLPDGARTNQRRSTGIPQLYLRTTSPMRSGSSSAIIAARSSDFGHAPSYEKARSEPWRHDGLLSPAGPRLSPDPGERLSPGSAGASTRPAPR